MNNHKHNNRHRPRLQSSASAIHLSVVGYLCEELDGEVLLFAKGLVGFARNLGVERRRRRHKLRARAADLVQLTTAR
jgi:hypothetical protein